MNKKQYLEYINHFNHKRYDAVTGYFAPDVSVEYFTNPGDSTPARTLHGRQGFIDSYKALHEYVREALERGDFMVSEDRLLAELYTEFHCFRDYPNFLGKTLKKGEVAVMTNWVLYDLEGGKMKRIRIAHFRMHDPKSARL
jgi:hypothetical protein